jgi:glycosyltransferase involved in cell wall biosynthesis
MNKTINILYLEHHSSIIGGGQISLMQLMKNLDKRKFNPILICPEKGDLAAEAKKHHIQTIFIPLPSLKALKVVTVFQSFRKLLNIIKKERVALLHANSSRSMMYAMLLRLFHRIEIIWHIRIVDKDSLFDRLFEPFANKIITNSKATARRFSWLKDQNKIVTIYNGLDLKSFDENNDGLKIKKELSIKDEVIIIGTIAKLQPKKGIHILLNAAPQIIKKFPSVKFLIVGDAPEAEVSYLKQLKSLIKKLNISKHVILPGFRNDISQIMKVIDIFVLTSFSESFGRVLIEAMAASKPIIASNVGGIPEVVTDGEAGILVPAAKVDVLAEKMNHLLQDKNLREQMGSQGRKRVEELFTIEQHVSSIEKVYSELTK